MLTIIEAIHGEGPLWFPGVAKEFAVSFDAKCTASLADSVYPETTEWRNGVVQIGERLAVLKNIETGRPTTVANLIGHWRDGDRAEIISALGLLDQIDGLTAVLATLVRAIYRLEADPDYDISHSDPMKPYSIYVSIPKGEQTASLRLAESLLHEAMHLQLSLIESNVRLVADNSQVGWSPWQGCERPPQGLLHGLYVFAVIHDFLKRLDYARKLSEASGQSVACMQAVADHIRRRSQQIADEVAELPDFSEALDPCGKLLRLRCIDTVLS